MSNDYPISGLINPQDKKDLEKLISDLNEASKVAKTVVLGGGDAKNLKQVAEAQEKINKSQREAETHAKKIEALNQKIAVTAQKEADRIEATRKKNADAELKRLEKEAQAQRKVTEQAEKTAQAQNKNVTNFKNATPGSINQLSSANAILNKRLLDVNQSTEEGARKANNLRSAIDKNHKKIAEMSPEWKKQQMNIGAYGNAFNFVADKAKSFGNTLKGLALGGIATLGIATSLGGIVSMFKSGVASAIAMEEKTEKLNFALNQNKPATDRMLSFASKMSANSLFGKGAIMEAETFALSLGRTEDQTKKMVTAAMGLSRVTGIDLQTAMGQLNMTYSGGLGRLAKYAPELKNLTAEQLKAGVGVEMLAQKLGKFATSGLDTTSGKITLFKKAWAGLTRSMGEGATGPIGAIVDGFTKITKAVVKFVSVPVSETMEKERIKVNQLTQVLSSNANPQAIRVKAYEELSKIAPSVVEGIDKENVNTIKLNKNLSDYNKLTIQKIALKAKEETLRTVEENAAKRLQENFEATLSFDKAMETLYNKISSKTPVSKMIELKKGMLETKKEYEANKITAIQYFEELEKWGNKFGAIGMSDVTDLKYTQAPWLVGTKKRYEQAQDEATKAMEEFDKFQANLEARFGKVVLDKDKDKDKDKTHSGKTKTQKEIDEDKLKSILELMKAQQEAFEQVANDESKSLMERSIAYQNFTSSKIKAIELQNKFDNKYNGSEKLTNDLILQNESNKVKLDADKWYQDESKKQQDKSEAEQEAKEKEYKDNMFNNAQRENERLIKENEILTDRLLEENANRYIKGEQSYEEYEKNKQKISEASAKELIRIQIQTEKAKLDVLENSATWDQETTDKIFSYKEKIAQLEKQLNQGVAEEHKKLDDERIERLETYAERTKEIANSISDLFSAMTEKKVAEIDLEIEKNTEAKDKEIENLDAMLANESISRKNYDKQKQKIEANAKKREDKYLRDKAKIEYDAEMWKWRLSFATITLNTAIAVIKAAPNPVAMALAGVVGAAALVTAGLSKPVAPKFKTGTNFHEGGLATVGDGGREILKMPDGNSYLASSEITASFPRGMKVLKNSDTEKVLKSGITVEQTSFDVSELKTEQQKTNKYLQKIAGKQTINRIFVQDNSQYNRAKWQ